MGDIQIFNIKGVDCYEKDGTAYLKLEMVAKGLGFTQTQTKNGTEYISVRWERIEQYLSELGFPHKWGKEDFIPENIFYRLAMKAKNETAEKFQALVADEIIPSIRKKGYYGAPKTTSEQIQLLAQGNVELNEKIESVNEDLQNFKKELPLLAIECQQIVEAKNRKIVPILGGKESNAYRNASLRGRVYRDLEGQLRREFGVTSYKAIKRNQVEKAVEIIKGYDLPLCLKDEVAMENAQMNI